MAIANYQAKKYQINSVANVTDALTVEEALEITINNKPFTVTMRTPGNDLELVRGLLYSEDIYTNKVKNFDLVIKKENDQGIINKVDVKIDEKDLRKGYLNSRSLLSVSSCGICGMTELTEVSGKVCDDVMLCPTQLPEMFNQMKEKQVTFKQSGGSHAAAAFSSSGKMLAIMEDIGRHNAVDKVVGKLVLDNTTKEAVCLTVSGRISYEIIVKAFRAKIPILAAVSAPSSLSVDYAKELGITLLGFCRGSNATCYATPHRLTNSKIIDKAS